MTSRCFFWLDGLNVAMLFGFVWLEWLGGFVWFLFIGGVGWCTWVGAGFFGRSWCNC